MSLSPRFWDQVARMEIQNNTNRGRTTSSGSSSTNFTHSSGGSFSNSNQSPNARNRRQRLLNQFRNEGRNESWWNPRYHRQEQNRRRSLRVANVMNPTKQRKVSPLLKSLVTREISGKRMPRFRSGNIAVSIRRATGRHDYYSPSEFNSIYGNKWKHIPSGSRRLISEDSNVQRKQVRVVRML